MWQSILSCLILALAVFSQLASSAPATASCGGGMTYMRYTCTCTYDSKTYEATLICGKPLSGTDNVMPRINAAKAYTVTNTLSAWPTFPAEYLTDEVTSIDLTKNNITGAMGDLTTLIDAGTITNEHIKKLSFARNRLTATNPQLCQFTALEELDLSYNKFQTFDLNDLVCDVQALQASLFFSSLKTLNLRGNQIKSLMSFDATFWVMPNLTSFDISSNQLTSINITELDSKALLNLDYAAQYQYDNRDLMRERALYNFSSNRITGVNFNSSAMFSYVEYYMNITSLESYFNEFAGMDFSRNSLVCSCSSFFDMMGFIQIFQYTMYAQSVNPMTTNLGRTYVCLSNVTNKNITLLQEIASKTIDYDTW